MCGRIIQSSSPLHLAIVDGLGGSNSRMGNIRPRYNAAPSQELLVIRENRKTAERSLDVIEWGLIPHWFTDPRGGRRPINAKAESVSKLPTFRDAYAQRRCIVPIDGFFECRAIKGARAKQPYAIAMKDGSPFGLGPVGELAQSEHRRMATNLCDHNRALQLIDRADPPSNASHLAARDLRALARFRRGSPRSSHYLSV